MKKILTLFLLCACSYVTGHAQQRFSRQQLSDDLDSMYSTMQQCHPDLFHTLPQAEFEAEWEQVRARLTDSMTVLDLFRIAGPPITRLGDGHTSVYPSSDEYSLNNIRAVPLSFDIDPRDTTMYVLHDLTGNQLIPVGAQIISIDGRTPRQMVDGILPYRTGESQPFRIQSSGLYAALYMAIVFEENGPYSVTYRHDGETATVRYDGIPMKDFMGTVTHMEASVSDPYTLEIDDKNNIAILYFNQCEFGPEGSLDRFLDSTFTVIRDRGVKDLVIDVRNNYGGNSPVGDAFFQYFSPVPFRQFDKTLVKWGEPILRTQGITDKEPGSFQLYEIETLNELKENPLRFTGNVYLLTSSKTFSAASSFTSGFQTYNMGTIIGEETGGWMVSFGNIAMFTTPNAGLPYGVSYKKFYQAGATEANRHGILPDYPVPASQAMDKAYELILGR